MWRSDKRLGLIVAFVIAWASHARAGTITMSPNPVACGSTDIGTTTTAVSGTLTDSTNDHVDLVIGSCSGATGSFTLTPSSNINLNPSASISVTYSPTGRGTRTCTVNVKDHGSTTVFGSFQVTGTGLAKQNLQVTSSVSFGSLRWNDNAVTPSASASLLVSNTGDDDLVINNVSLSGSVADYVVSGGVSLTLRGGQSHLWSVTFNPTSSGTKDATLQFASNDPAGTKNVMLTGVGTNAIISVTDNNYPSVPVTFSQNIDITLSNIAATPVGGLGRLRAQILDDPNGWFSFSGCFGGTAHDCPISSLVGTTPLLVGVSCSPPSGTIDGSTMTAHVTFASDTDNAGSNPDNVSSLTCKASAPVLSASAMVVTFMPQLVGTSTTSEVVIISNTGTQDYAFTFTKAGANAGAFAVTPSCDVAGCMVAKNGGTFTFTVTFTPPSEGDLSATLNLGGYPFTLTGRGVAPHISVPMTHMFPDTYKCPGDLAAIEPIPVQDTGEYPLSISALSAGPFVWSVAPDQPTPYDVPGAVMGLAGMGEANVRFAPQDASKAPTGYLMITNNDLDTAKQLVMVQLTGNGKERVVNANPSVILMPDTGAGVPIKYSDPEGALFYVNNTDDTDFTITSLAIEPASDAPADNAKAFEVIDPDPKSDTVAKAGGQKGLDIRFTPPRPGDYLAVVAITFDHGECAQLKIPVHGRALFATAHGSGCATGGGSGIGIVLAALFLRRRRRR